MLTIILNFLLKNSLLIKQPDGAGIIELPHWNDAPALLSGLREFASRTAGVSALVQAAVLSLAWRYPDIPTMSSILQKWCKQPSNGKCARKQIICATCA